MAGIFASPPGAFVCQGSADALCCRLPAISSTLKDAHWEDAIFEYDVELTFCDRNVRYASVAFLLGATPTIQDIF